MLIVAPWGSTRRPSDRPTGTNSVEPPLTRPAPAPNTRAPSSGKSIVWVITRSRASRPASGTALPSLNAPYRAFQRSELGAAFSLPDGGGTPAAGAYRYASHTLELGVRGGPLDPH